MIGVLDTGKRERLLMKYIDAPCMLCKHYINNKDFDDISCPAFKNGIIPDDIVSGKNQHLEIHHLQINDTVFERRISIFDK